MMKEVRKMAYSTKFKEDVLSKFHASGMPMRAACAHYDDFPDARTLSKFVSEEEAGLLRPPVLEVPGRCEGRRAWESYPLETKREALRLLASGMEPRHIARRLNIADARSIRNWASNLGDLGDIDARSHVDATPGQAVMMFAQGSSVAEVAKRASVSRMTVCRWLDKAGIDRSRAKKRRSAGSMVKKEGSKGGEWTRAWGELPEDDPEERARVAEVRLAEAGRPKSTRPELFEQLGEASGGRGGEGDDAEDGGR